MRYSYPPPETATDHRYDYYWELLQAALEATRPSHGPYELAPFAEVMNAARAAISLQYGAGITVVMFIGTAEREKTLLPVRIPLDKGLTGYRMLLIKKDVQSRLDKVNSVGDLKAIRLGQGATWIDTEILRAAGLVVDTSPTYEGLFLMLSRDRFEAFPRGINEIVGELATYKATIPELAIEKNLLLHYPQARYFFFQRSPQGEKLAERVEAGLKLLIKSGEFESRYRRFKARILTGLDLSGRRVLRLNNPALSPETPLKNKDLWDSLSKELRAKQP